MDTKSSASDQAKTIYRPYDRVEIIAPHVFKRCGYPIDVKELADTFTAAQITEAIRAVYPNHPEYDRNYWPMERVAKALAAAVAAERRFGGNLRSIHTEQHDDIVGQVVTVCGKRVVMTGERCPAYQDYDGEWEQAYLGHAEAHVILNVGGNYKLGVNDGLFGGMVLGFEIEARHVRLVSRGS
ncbi:MAG: hypothetical protein WC829_01785 [Hyphomicrobium sp.]|jgi:hypothetical protein